MDTHLERLWCAMFVSEGWYEMWRLYNDYPLELPEGKTYRKFALKAKMNGIIEYDRVLNNYESAIKCGDSVPSMFVNGE